MLSPDGVSSLPSLGYLRAARHCVHSDRCGVSLRCRVQEIADYAILTSPSGAGLKPLHALLLNLLSGFSVVLGARPRPACSYDAWGCRASAVHCC